MSLAKIRSALKAAGRQRNLDTRALQIQEVLRTEQLAAPAAVTAAFGASTRDVGVRAAHRPTHPNSTEYGTIKKPVVMTTAIKAIV